MEDVRLRRQKKSGFGQLRSLDEVGDSLRCMSSRVSESLYYFYVMFWRLNWKHGVSRRNDKISLEGPSGTFLHYTNSPYIAPIGGNLFSLTIRSGLHHIGRGVLVFIFWTRTTRCGTPTYNFLSYLSSSSSFPQQQLPFSLPA